MLRKAKQLEGYELRARDGRIGQVKDFLIDDRSWTIRYFVVATEGWRQRRDVLISPVAVSAPDWEKHLLPVDLTKEQIRESPSIDLAEPVSHEHEGRLTEYYNWPAYWDAAGFPAVTFALPMVPNESVAAGAPSDASQRKSTVAGRSIRRDDAGPNSPPIHATRRLGSATGFHLEGNDGAIGHVDDFLLDDRTWQIRYLVIDTRNFLPGKKVLVAPAWIRDVRWSEGKVDVDLSRETIKSGPEYQDSRPFTAEDAGKLHDHYGQPRYDTW